MGPHFRPEAGLSTTPKAGPEAGRSHPEAGPMYTPAAGASFFFARAARVPRAAASSSTSPGKVAGGEVVGGALSATGKVDDAGCALTLGGLGARSDGGAGQMAPRVEELGRAAWKGMSLLYMHRARVVPPRAVSVYVLLPTK